MMSRSTRGRPRAGRTALVALVLVLITAGGASAGMIAPLEDAGGPDGGGQTGVLDEAQRSQDLIALSGGIDTAGTLDESDFTGIAPADMPTAGGGVTTATLDESQRSQDLIALSGGTLAINGRGQVAYEETERALAANAGGGEVAEMATSPSAAHTAF